MSWTPESLYVGGCNHSLILEEADNGVPSSLVFFHYYCLKAALSGFFQCAAIKRGTVEGQCPIEFPTLACWVQHDRGSGGHHCLPLQNQFHQWSNLEIPAKCALWRCPNQSSASSAVFRFHVWRNAMGQKDWKDSSLKARQMMDWSGGDHRVIID